MSTLAVVSEVLREVAPRALKAWQIVELAGDRLPTASRTPETVVSRDLAIDVKNRGASSRFLRVERGEFLLKEALPTAFYNDNEAYAAAWTRQLIAAGEIAAGVVDERSIRDIKPADVAGYRQFHAFSGIGVWSRALRDAGWPDDANVWSGSCPCQSFSQAGKRQGFTDARHLWPEWFRLIRACRPSVVVGEQVSSKDGLAWVDLVFADLEGADYAVRALDIPAASVGAPHRRQRLYFVAYARERGRELLSAPWVHARRQSGNHVAGCGAVDGGEAGTESDSNAWHEGWTPLAEGNSKIGVDDEGACELGDAGRSRFQGRVSGPSGAEFAGTGETDGTGIDDEGACELGDAGLARGRRNAGEVHCAQGGREGARVEAWALAHEPFSPSAADRIFRPNAEPTFCPGDRIRLEGDPSWGGAVGGFWAEAVEWVYCRPEPGQKEGRWRPVESGTQPLVAGTATSVGRTRSKRLKGFGNAIVLPCATAFVAAVIDAFAEAADGVCGEDLTSGLGPPLSTTELIP